MGFINEVKSHRNRTWKSVCAALLLTSLGLHSAIFGPSLIDLMVQVNTTIDQITHILPVRAFGNMIGSTLCGFVLAYFDIQVVLIMSMGLMSLSIVFVPLCSSLWQLYSVMILNGFSGGFLVNACNCFVIHAWGKENSPFMQLAHFMFGIGAFTSPFLTEPFLRDINDVEIDFEMPSSSKNTTEDISKTALWVDPSTLKIKYAFFIVGALSFLIWIVFVITYLNKRSNKPHPSREIKVKQANPNESVVKVEIVKLSDIDLKDPNNNKDSMAIVNGKSDEVFNYEKKIKFHHKAVIVMLAALFIHLAYGLELSFGVMLASYARLSHLQFDKTSASFVTSLYWFSFTFFRLCCLIMINFVSARSMLIIDLVLIMISNCILLPLIWYEYSWALWVGSAFMGIGVSSIYPTLWSFLETILPVTSKMTSIVNSCACVGEFIVPVLIGLYLETNPNVFIYVVMIYSGFACVIFALSCTWEYVINKYKRS